MKTKNAQNCIDIQRSAIHLMVILIESKVTVSHEACACALSADEDDKRLVS